MVQHRCFVSCLRNGENHVETSLRRPHHFTQSRFPATVEARPSELVRVDSKDLHQSSF